MDSPNCEWVRGRLPLYAGSGDLGEGDRRAVARHLARCSGCRRHRAGLSSAMGALAAVAATAPEGGPASASLWSALERRISARGVGAASTSASATLAAWSGLDDDRPMRSAWAKDTLREAAEAIGWREAPDRWRWEPPAGARRVAVASLAASILMLSVVLPTAWRWRAAAEARELALAEPVPPLVGPPAPGSAGTGDEPDERLAGLDPMPVVPEFGVVEPDPGPEPDRDPGPAPRVDRREVDARQLARAEPIRPPAPIATAPTREASPPNGPARFGFDPVELGTPMPPDGRDSRPIY